MGILFIVATILRLDFVFAVFYLFALVYGLSHLWVQSIKRNLEVERQLTDRAFCGDRVRVRLWLNNSGWLPVPWLEVHESLPVQLATPPFYRYALGLRGRVQRSLEYELHPQERGYYEIGPLTVRTGDLMGFARSQTVRHPVQPMLVYPKVLPLHKLGLPTHSPQVALPARSPLFQDPSRVMGVRDYQRGDSPRRLHWTATAKASACASMTRLMVKQYQAAISRETLICLDLHREDYGRRHWSLATERAIVVAASLANHIVVRERLPVGLVTEAQDPRRHGDPEVRPRPVRFALPPRAGQGQLMRLLEVLACAQVISGSESAAALEKTTVTGSSSVAAEPATASFAALLREMAGDLPWGATLSIITGSERQELLDTLFYLRRAGFAVVLILVQPGRAPASITVGRQSVPVYRVWEERDVGAALGRTRGAPSGGMSAPLGRAGI